MASTIITKFSHLQIPLEDVVNATNNFHQDNIIGHGGLGTAYKGQLLESGKLIKVSALKLDRRQEGEGDFEFWTEISMLSDLSHTNIVSIVGFCYEKDEKVIITSYAAKGSLNEHLNNPNLTWTQRLKICVGVARALSYLHHDEGRGYGVIHLNINSSSILLDENWEPKLSGFKVSVKQSINRMHQVILSEPIGAIGYADPEIEKSKGVTHKTDIYSFGVVLFELLCGRRAYIKNEADRFLARLTKHHYENETLLKIIHPDLRNQISPYSLRIYSKAAYSCIQKERTNRPNILILVDKLEKALKQALKFKPNFGKNLEHLKIQLHDIKLATDNFSDKYKNRSNNYYTWYTLEIDHFDNENTFSKEGKSKSELPKRHNTVVMKRFLPVDDEQEENFFFTELEMLTSVKHHNIVNLLGFCVEGSELMLVTEKISNRDLSDYLGGIQEISILTWENRLKICISIAQALTYLHFEMEDNKVMIHGNINPARIVFNENWEAKIQDFQLAVFLPPNQKDELEYRKPHIESWYHVDPEYENTGKLKREMDVYSFGVVMFEIVCGRYAGDQIYLKESAKGLLDVARRNFTAGTLEDMIDTTLKEKDGIMSCIPNRRTNKKSLQTFLKIAIQCVIETQDKRPTMKVVLKELEKALFFQVEGIKQLDKDQVIKKLEALTHELLEEQVQQPENDQVVKKLDIPSQEIHHQQQEQLIIIKKLEHLKIPLTDIKLVTDDFSEAYKIQNFEDECTMYRAKLNYSSVEENVVIKRYPSRSELYGEREFFREIEVLSGVKHPNIVTILGFCFEASEMILVFDNLSNGSLGGCLGKVNDMCVLNWEKRLNICIDVARALKYIHYEMEDQKMIINRDICSDNIMLDKNWRAKIVYFGDSVFLPSNQKDETLFISWIGRTPYTDPEYKKTDKLKRESDVYSFGVVLFEILCGRRADDPIYVKENEVGLASVARQCYCSRRIQDIIDPIIKEGTGENNFVLNSGPNKDSLHTFIEIAYHCVIETQDQRPTMKVVVNELEKAIFFQNNKMNNPRISLEAIKVATQNFHNDNCIGGGGFGRVFKGKLQDGDELKTIVAKRLDTRFGQGEQQFWNELQILFEYKHENVISLIGYCDEKDEKVIVYEYAPKGSLDRYLKDVSLTWVKRLNLCIDVATALYFLHGGVGKQAKVIHRDIKIANILLNHEWKAKLGDFGLSLISPITHQTEYVIDYACGTPGYVDPLYEKSRFLTIESDVYSFGVVLFEILCGRSTFEIKKHKGHFLPEFIRNIFEEGKHDDMVFEQIREQIEPKSLATFQEIAYQCLYHEREKRPTTKTVLTQLKKALEIQKMVSTVTKFAHLKIPLKVVVKATNNFNQDDIIGHGGFSTTYKGRLLQCGRLMNIAAQKFDCKHVEADLEFLRKISVLIDLKHTNLISIVGFCDEEDEKIIVTKYEANRCLGQYLSNSNLTWAQRLRICLGVARALSYLHYFIGRDYAIIHGNINSDKILLDVNLEAKLSGFETSIKQSVHKMDQVYLCEQIGTMGYIDPEIEKTGGVTYKSDIYSFGVVLFEMLCWRNAYVRNEAKSFLAPLAKYHYENKNLQKIICPDLHSSRMSPQSLLKYSSIAYSCLNEDRAYRPNMDYIAAELERALELQMRRENTEKKFEYLKISFVDIKSATNDFSETYKISSWDKYTLYRAELNHFDKDNSLSTKGKNTEHPKVVIKRYPYGKDACGEEKFYTEIEMLSSVKHPNIVTLVGFCLEGSEMILVTKNVSNGYLYDYLGNVNDMRILTWEKRLKICIDVAHALEYLHYGLEDQKVIINRDISSTCIVLDENWGSKIVDFWWSVFLPPNQADEALYLNWIGKPFYIDPEYKKTNKLKRESDVYSFGVVLFEILCGRRANHPIYLKENEKGLAHVARQCFFSGSLEAMIDPLIKEETDENIFVLNRGPNKDSLHTFIKIAHQCLALTQNQRPTIKVVVEELEKALFLQKNKDDPKIALEDIKMATQNFHDDNCIGEEGFEKVYKGKLQDSEEFNIVAAKRLDTRLGQKETQFLSELQILWEYKHENVIGLVGYSDEQDEKVVVYEYASRRSLDRYLNDATLTWMKRLNICIDIARALDFIHGGDGKQTKVIHGDIKTANILLNDDWKAKLAGFGLSLISPITQEKECVIDYACGTRGYVDPLYKKSGYLTVESDIYSFGVVMFEILCGRSTIAIHEHEGHYLPEFIKNIFEDGKHDEMVFNQIREQIKPKSLATFQEIAYQCLHHEREKRPTTKRVLTQLKKALAIHTLASTITKFAHLQIPLEDVVKATDNFHHDNIIGHSGFSTTYKGRLLQSGRLMKIAARKFNCKHVEADLEFLREISVLFDHKHTNLISIFGFCDEEDEKIIVTMYEANKCLGNHLSNPKLTWKQRLRICLGVARVLSYLHYSKGRDYDIIHCNINSDTILLDDNWEAKLSGFETSIKRSVYNKDQVCPCEHIGTMGYMDPTIEKTGGVTHKSDIYSFGVVLFELLCGRKAFVQNQAKSFPAPLAKYHYENKTLQDIIFPDLQRNLMSPQSLLRYSHIAYSCLNEDRAHRPNMDYIAYELERALELQLQLENIEKKFEYSKISLADIKSATNDFSNTYRIASRFDYPYALYRAELKHFDKDNSLSKKGKKGEHPKVVIKRYPYGNMSFGEEAFCKEIEMLSRVKHPNVVTLLGFCLEGSEMILVTENVSNGYLVYHLGNTDQMHIFTWEKRLKICIDVAHALKYLHYEMEDQKVIINRDITSYSIGLDENLKAKIVDFCLSVILPPNQNDEALYLKWFGRPAYADPEYKKTNKLKKESDVYSFGVVLFEILCGRTAFDQIYENESAKGLAHVARQSFSKGTLEDMIDPLIKGKTSESRFVLNRGPNRDSLRTFIQIAHQCVSESLNQRPTMKAVVKELEKALFLQVSCSNFILSIPKMTKFAHLQIPLEDVVKATDNFHHDNIIGHGGFSTTYKGRLLQSGRLMKIAARKFNCKHVEADLEFFREISVLLDHKHTNLISIIGFCDEEHEKIIVTMYEAKSLGQYLNSPNLTWTQRLKLSVGVAHALSYLHYSKGHDYAIIHCNINSDTILLDDNWEAKLFGFETSIKRSVYNKDQVCPCEHIGTMGYTDATIEKTGGVTHKSDIYSFGVVLFELLCGRKAFVQNQAKSFLAPLAKYHYENKTLQDIIFPDLQRNLMSPQSLLKYSNIAYSCLNEDQADRPNMDYIVDQLDKALKLQMRRENIGNNLEHLKLPLSDIILATDHFSDTSRTTVGRCYSWYIGELDCFNKEKLPSIEGETKGKLSKKHKTVLIRRIRPSNDEQAEEVFYTEIEVLSSVKHHNIVSLLGFCIEGSEMIIVTDNVSNKYLCYCLKNSNDKRILTWEKRLKICIDVAQALNYLHSEMEDQKMVILRFLDTYDIRLDENWGAKIAMFVFSVFMPPNQEDEAIFLNMPANGPFNSKYYLDPEYVKSGNLKRESDVHCFGVILFEVLCGRLADDPIYQNGSNKGLAHVARQCFHAGTIEEMIDPIMKEEAGENNFVLNKGPNKESLRIFIEIAHKCLAETQDQRPTMKVVLEELEKALFIEENKKDNLRIPHEDIKLATRNFHDDNCIGGGGFGKFYKGTLQDGDEFKTTVAKRLDTKLGQVEKQFLNELQILWEYKHENVIGLVGYCDELEEKIIVYEYVPRGSLDKFLNDASLTWMKRLNICIDVARVLDFIHGGVIKQTKVIHGDIKSANILLDHDWKAKLEGFGLSLISPITQKIEYVIDYECGTPGYVDPLYQKSGYLTVESDIYSFGVVMFEILCGRATFAIHEHEGHYLPEFIKNKFEKGKHNEVVFEQIREQIVPESLTTFQEIAYQCLHVEREKRPAAKEVLMQLKMALEFQVPTKPKVNDQSTTDIEETISADYVDQPNLDTDESHKQPLDMSESQKKEVEDYVHAYRSPTKEVFMTWTSRQREYFVVLCRELQINPEDMDDEEEVAS